MTTSQQDASVLNTDSISKTTETLIQNNFLPITVENKAEALTKIKELIPAGASVMNGSSVTLEEVGFVDYLKSGEHGWDNLHAKIFSESDPIKQGHLRKLSTISDFYLGSVHALTETGVLLIASNTGSQLPNIDYSSQNLIFVVGEQKIVPTLGDAFERLEKVVIPLEDVRIQKAYGIHTTHAKTLILHKENPMMGRKVYVIIVKESLGY